MEDNPRLRRLRFRAWHRGTKEADLMVGGFFNRYGTGWDEAEIAWFELFLEEQDVDIMAWGLGTQPVPAQFEGPMMDAFRKLDFIQIEP
ncbi:succinate dehydrogenase assembly factor 2 [Sphingobium phenoxybenzoativorans]|uniref:FAD assembly factor SdhE n=1 Tax=Sphingobium phenoxybenzoativorans TaxID=1592790 RepID=A0A975KAD4_9SPHN|nr:succinate dehydrogenase assembly factor 2 [Sphingobium phenoxybenzoativorans]QUT07756.1 succinate dehydrogenase assembly factor 2 [Sphingobium phenoxybenzoativorans]